MNILLLTSEFTPAAGGIGTYAREIAAAAVRLGADVTVVAPDYADEGVARADRAAPFRTHRFRGGLHSMRDLPGKVRLARTLIAADGHDVVHAVDWPFFLPLVVPHGPGTWHYLGEDWAFSHRLAQIGVVPLADTTIRLWHWGRYGFSWEDAGSDVKRFRSYSYRII